MIRISLLLAITFLIMGCQPDQLDLGPGANFYPPIHQLKKGLVNKFYQHHYPASKDRLALTDIEYWKYQLKGKDELLISRYNASFYLTQEIHYLIQDGKLLLKDLKMYSEYDEIAIDIDENIDESWKNNEAVSSATYIYDSGFKISGEFRQMAIEDARVDDLNCKVILKEGDRETITNKGDTIRMKMKMSTTYAANIGRYANLLDMGEHGKTVTELVEQMSVSDFEELANHGVKRVAYIDPNQTMDNNPSFKICGKETIIKDYYNCDLRGELIGGKGSWKRILEKHLNPDLLRKESGYLTYRFVINCEGETGRFRTEQADLNFNKKTFNPTTIDHLYQIVKMQKDWQPCKSDKVYDAYAYITFKLEDGKIIELLP